MSDDPFDGCCGRCKHYSDPRSSKIHPAGSQAARKMQAREVVLSSWCSLHKRRKSALDSCPDFQEFEAGEEGELWLRR